jgi:hypothetical protein
MKKQTAPTGLMNSVAETPVQRAQREAKRSFVDSWRRKHPDLDQDLAKLSKADLIDLYARSVVGDVYDAAVSMGSSSAQSDDVTLAEITRLCDTLLRGPPDEMRAVVEEWGARAIAAANGDEARVIEISRAVASTLVRIELRPQVKSHRSRKEGGKKRGEQQREEKTERYAQIEEKQNELADTMPPHKLNKAIAKATGFDTAYVRTARKKMSK